ncbi:hypothetical protein [uncultured Microbacterium sp.]|uniref:hypothetical protein n=1 Tax=uncultured Microbacterium sp. TaxID=191216 RepID=UPI0025F21035|nr:hypothetical protein [uncultured Microbacterium sp.]
MTLTNSWPGVGNAATTTDARKNLAGLIETSAGGGVLSGVFPAGVGALVTARADLNVDIQPFQGVAVQFGGPVLLANDGVIQLPSALVSPASGTNYYVVYVKQNEATAPGTDANNNRVAAVTLSTASIAAARGLLPQGALELATVTLPSGKTATNQSGVIIAATHRFTATEGGTVLVRNSSELSAWAPADGATAYQLDTQTFYVRRAGFWVAGAPTIDVVAGITRTITGSVNVELWSVPNTGESIMTGGDWFDYDPATGDITCKRDGRYSIEARLAVAASGNSPQPEVAVYIIRNGTPTDILTQDAVMTRPSFSTMAKLSVASIFLAAGTKLRVWVPSGGVIGSVTLGGAGRGNGEFAVKFLG